MNLYSIAIILTLLQKFFLEVAADERIVGGNGVDPDRYPFQVGLISHPNGSPYCGGSLVDPEWVLSAAHCAGYGSYVVIGRHDFSDDDENFEVIEIDWVTVHPDYNSYSLDNDYMMVKLKENSTHAPVILDDGSNDLSDGAAVTVIGWGTTSSGGSVSNVLLEVEVDIVSNDKCDDAYGDITNNMVCAAKDGKDSCQGDSGGPLIIKGDEDDMSSVDIQVGVVSWGRGCAQEGYPGVYARVSGAIDWINEQILDGQPPPPNDNANSDDDCSWCGGNDNDGLGDASVGGGGGGLMKAVMKFLNILLTFWGTNFF